MMKPYLQRPLLNKMNPLENNFSRLQDLVRKHDRWMDETINLIASENRLSPIVNEVLTSDLGNRVAEGWLGERVFPGIKYYDELEEYGMNLVKQTFRAEFVDIRPISGTMANMIVYSAFTEPGDTIASLSIASGAHISMAGSTPRKIFHLNLVEIPFNIENFNIDVAKSIELLQDKKPKILVLGGSVLLFPQPLKELVQVCKDLNILTLFDASHVAGLIASGHYPNPFDDGFDIMTMTTCKTIPGPQHAFVLSRSQFSEKLKRAAFPGFLSGHHLNETVASIFAMEEFKVFGTEYSDQILKNSKDLARNLSESGFDVVAKDKGFTETHMFLIDISTIMPAYDAEKILEQANIFVNKNLLPFDKSFTHPRGLRLGTPEITRLGMKEKDMATIAGFISRLLIKRENPEIIKNEVRIFREKFKKIHYCNEVK